MKTNFYIKSKNSPLGGFRGLFLLTICLFAINTIQASDFTKGNLVILSVGQSSETLSDAGNTVFLNEYDTTGTLVQSIQMPNSGRTKLILSGADYYSGYLNRSTDQKYLTLAGFNASIGQVTDLDASDPTSVNRIVAVVDASGSYDVSTKMTDVTCTPRGVASTNGKDLWMSAPTGVAETKNYGGILYTQLGNTTRTADINRRKIIWSNAKLFNQDGYDMLFSCYSYAGDGNQRLYGFVTEDEYKDIYNDKEYSQIPKEFSSSSDFGYAESSFSQLPNTLTDFVFIDQNSSIRGLDVAYFCSCETSSGSLTKSYCTDVLSSSSTYYQISDNSYYYFGITEGSVSECLVVLYATRLNNSTGNYELVKITDQSGYNGDPSGKCTIEVLATAASGTAFRGIDFAPQTESDKKVQTVSGLEYEIEKTYGDERFKLDATATSTGNTISYAIADNSVATIDANDYVTIVGAGETTIAVSIEGNDTYKDFDATLTLTVDKAYQIQVSGPSFIRENGYCMKTTVDDDFSLTTVLSSGLTPYYVSDDDAVVSVDEETGLAHIEGEGTCNLYVIEDGNDNYESFTSTYILKVESSSKQTISNFDNMEVAVGSSDFTLSATASGGGNITYSSDNYDVATIIGSTVHVVGHGQATITAYQAGDSDHDPVTATATLYVKYTQTITGLKDTIFVNVDNTSFYLPTSTSAELAPSYDVYNNDVVSVDNSTAYVDIHKIGETAITASQSGNDDYMAATSITFILKVVAAGAGVDDIKSEQGFVAINTSDKNIAVFCKGNYNDVDWQLYSLSGNAIASGNITSVNSGDIITLNAAVNSGIYLLRLTTGDNESFCLKMVK